MAFSPDYRTFPNASAATGAAVIDAGLRAYMLRVYNWMCSGLLLTGVVAYGIANTGLINAFYQPAMTASGRTVMQPTFLAMAAIFAPLAFMLVLSFGVNKMSKTAVQGVFWAFCAAMGASMVNIFLIYTNESIVRVFFITAATFAANDTQRIRADYVQYAYAEGTDGAAKRSVFDALSLYLNFINLFMLLLQLLGNRNNN